MKKLFVTLIAVFAGVFAAFAQTTFEVNFKELPKDIQKYISKNYEGYTVDKAVQEQNEKGKVSFTDVFVSKGADKLKLVFDKKDEFVKKEALTAAATPPVKPATKPDSTAKQR